MKAAFFNEARCRAMLQSSSCSIIYEKGIEYFKHLQPGRSDAEYTVIVTEWVVKRCKEIWSHDSWCRDEADALEEYLDRVKKGRELSSGNGGCYVATAVYGSYDCPQVWTLRRYRDYTLAETWYGRAFIRTYYAISPTLVKWFGHTAWFKKIWKGKLDRMVANLNANGVENTPYEDKNW